MSHGGTLCWKALMTECHCLLVSSGPRLASPGRCSQSVGGGYVRRIGGTYGVSTWRARKLFRFKERCLAIRAFDLVERRGAGFGHS
jgi:hypothetical protein